MVDLLPFNLAFATMMLRSVFLVPLLGVLGGCATPPPAVPQRPCIVQTEPGETALLNELARVATLTPERRHRELLELEAERRLSDAKRFQMAALLERDDNVEALERSLKSLGAMTGIEPSAQPLIELMKKSLRARIALKQQTARSQELQDKLEQIKALEKSLQQRDALPKSP